jgi:hypothetical protein
MIISNGRRGYDGLFDSIGAALTRLDPTVQGSVGNTLLASVPYVGQQAQAVATGVGQANAAAARQRAAEAEAKARADALARGVPYVPPGSSFFDRYKLPILIGGGSLLLLGVALTLKRSMRKATA